MQTPTLNLMVAARARDPRPRPPGRTGRSSLEADFSHAGANAHTVAGSPHRRSGRRPRPPTILEYKAGRLFDRDARSHRPSSPRWQKVEVREPRPRSGARSPSRTRRFPSILTSASSARRTSGSTACRRKPDARMRPSGSTKGHKLLTYPRTDSRHLPDDYRSGGRRQLLTAIYGTLPGQGPLGRARRALARQASVTAGPLNLNKRPRLDEGQRPLRHRAHRRAPGEDLLRRRSPGLRSRRPSVPRRR